jgi:23S rRNA (cytidine1920-2'-O)/16S rRNA (cytidine1409-2'-O)-methyltransferase
VIHDPGVHRQVLEDTLTFALAQGFQARGLLRSPLLGPKGNTEFLAWLELSSHTPSSYLEMIDKLFA